MSQNTKHLNNYIATTMRKMSFLAYNAMETRLLNIKRAIKGEKNMVYKITECPCDKAPYPWCNNAEGCGSCPEYEAWIKENDL